MKNIYAAPLQTVISDNMIRLPSDNIAYVCTNMQRFALRYFIFSHSSH